METKLELCYCIFCSKKPNCRRKKNSKLPGNHYFDKLYSSLFSSSLQPQKLSTYLYPVSDCSVTCHRELRNHHALVVAWTPLEILPPWSPPLQRKKCEKINFGTCRCDETQDKSLYFLLKYQINSFTGNGLCFASKYDSGYAYDSVIAQRFRIILSILFHNQI